MNEVDLFISLEKCEKSELIDLLENSYFEMNSEQRHTVFGSFIKNEINTMKIESEDAKDILSELKGFYKESLNGMYYAPFNINSKNYREIPEETAEWCHAMGLFLDKSSQLTQQNFHKEAVQCFYMLFTLIDKMGDDHIVFGDEIGSWMVGGDRKNATACYLSSASKILSPKKFTEHVILLLQIDSYESFSNNVYKNTLALATKEQLSALQIEIKQKKLRVM